MQTRAQFTSMAIDALGGTTTVAAMLALDYRVISNWRTRGFPPDVYDALAPLLRKRGFTVPPGFFGQRPLVKPKSPRRRRPKQESQHASTG